MNWYTKPKKFQPIHKKIFHNKNSKNIFYNPQMDRAMLSRIIFISSSCIFSMFSWALRCVFSIMYSNKIMQDTSSNYNISLVLNVIRWHLPQNSPSILPHSKSSLNHTSEWWVNIVRSFFYLIPLTRSLKIWKMIFLSFIWCQISYP